MYGVQVKLNIVHQPMKNNLETLEYAIDNLTDAGAKPYGLISIWVQGLMYQYPTVKNM